MRLPFTSRFSSDRPFKPIFLILALGTVVLLAITRFNLQAQTTQPSSLTLPTLISTT